MYRIVTNAANRVFDGIEVIGSPFVDVVHSFGQTSPAEIADQALLAICKSKTRFAFALAGMVTVGGALAAYETPSALQICQPSIDRLNQANHAAVSGRYKEDMPRTSDMPEAAKAVVETKVKARLPLLHPVAATITTGRLPVSTFDPS